jgi:MoaF C-terminal domain
METETRYFPLDDGLRTTDELAGKCANFHYTSGEVLQQEWGRGSITWRGVTGARAGHEQTESTLRVFRVADGSYLITWCEDGTVAATGGPVLPGPFPVAVLADFDTMRATAAYTNPAADGSIYHIVDQARIEWVSRG